jgi:hypothetical protein
MTAARGGWRCRRTGEWDMNLKENDQIFANPAERASLPQDGDEEGEVDIAFPFYPSKFPSSIHHL